MRTVESETSSTNDNDVDERTASYPADRSFFRFAASPLLIWSFRLQHFEKAEKIGENRNYSNDFLSFEGIMSAAPVRVRYAVFAVFELARAFRSRKPISARKIASKYRLSEKFLAVILQDLKKNGLVSTARGPLGGFRLTSAPEELTLGYVVALAENSPSPTRENAAKNDDPKIPDVSKLDADASATRLAFERAWEDAETKRQEFLNKILFSDLIVDSKSKIRLDFSI